MSKSNYDFLIIGGGSAGFAAAIKASELGAKAAIIESGKLGGTCVNVGCVPSKTLIRAAEKCYQCSYSKFKGIALCPPPEDWNSVVKMKDELVAELRKEKYVNVASSYPGISILKGEARFTDHRTISINGDAYTAGKFLIAAGSSPWVPPIPGLERNGFLDSTAALSIPKLPESMAVIGAGAIGLEYAQFFARFGVKITLIEVTPRIAPLEEPEISSALSQYLTEEKIDIHAGVSVANVKKCDSGFHIEINKDGKTRVIETGELLVAAGRRPNTHHLNLEKAGVSTGKKGEVIVNEHLQTSNPDVYAAGDVIGDPMFVYVVAYAGTLAAENALNLSGRVYDLTAVPRVTFTDPQIASVGLTEGQAREKGYDVRTSVIHAKDVPRAIVTFDKRGLIKLIAESHSGKLLGAHIIAPEAGDIIQEAALAIRYGMTYKDIIDTFHPYLTWAEGIKLAAIGFEKDVKKLSCCAS